MSDINTAPSAPQAPAAPAPITVDSLAQSLDNKNNPAAPPVAPTTPAEVKAEIKRIKQLQLKVYGQDVTEELPFEIEDTPQAREYMIKQLQMSKAAQRAMQEKGTQEKQIENFLASLKGNTAEVLMQMGIDPVAFAAQQLEAEIAKQKMSPEERKAQELEQKYKKLEEESKRKEMEFKQREFETKVQQIHDQLENQIITALDKTDLPQTPYVADRIAKYMSLALQDPEGPVKLTPEDVIPFVREDMMNDLQHAIKGMKASDIEKFVGKEVFDMVRKDRINKVKQMTPATAKAAIKDTGAKGKPSEPTKEAPKVNAKQFFGF